MWGRQENAAVYILIQKKKKQFWSLWQISVFMKPVQMHSAASAPPTLHGFAHFWISMRAGWRQERQDGVTDTTSMSDTVCDLNTNSSASASVKV